MEIDHANAISLAMCTDDGTLGCTTTITGNADGTLPQGGVGESKGVELDTDAGDGEADSGLGDADDDFAGYHPSGFAVTTERSESGASTAGAEAGCDETVEAQGPLIDRVIKAVNKNGLCMWDTKRLRQRDYVEGLLAAASNR